MLLRGVCVCLPVLLNVFVRIGCKLHTHFLIADRGTRSQSRGDAEPAHLVLVGNQRLQCCVRGRGWPALIPAIRLETEVKQSHPHGIRRILEYFHPSSSTTAVEGAVRHPDPDAVVFYLTSHFCLFAELILRTLSFLNATIHPR